MLAWQTVAFVVVPIVALVTSLVYTAYSSYRLRDWRPLLFAVVLFAMTTHQFNELATILERDTVAVVTGFGEYPETVANLAASLSVVLVLRLTAQERRLKEQLAEQVEQERELRRENERLNEFVSVVSHDLRNPLNVAKTRVTLAQDDLTDEDGHLDGVENAVDRMAALIDDLLALARRGERIGELEPVSLGQLCVDCWHTVQTSDATLRAHTDLTVQADRSRLKQLIENLLRNAVEHGGEDVTITIGALENRDGFYVADDGEGLSAADRDEIFEHGFSTADDGTGFGLAIVEQIADAHGWAVSVTESSGGGARFEITGVDTVAQHQMPAQ